MSDRSAERRAEAEALYSAMMGYPFEGSTQAVAAIERALLAAEDAALERAATLHESVRTHRDHEPPAGAGAMGAGALGWRARAEKAEARLAEVEKERDAWREAKAKVEKQWQDSAEFACKSLTVERDAAQSEAKALRERHERAASFTAEMLRKGEERHAAAEEALRERIDALEGALRRALFWTPLSSAAMTIRQDIEKLLSPPAPEKP